VHKKNYELHAGQFSMYMLCTYSIASVMTYYLSVSGGFSVVLEPDPWKIGKRV